MSTSRTFNRPAARVLAVLVAVALSSCKLEPGRTGVCLGPTPLALETFTRAEAFHDDCRGPDGSGDIFTLSLAAQSNVLLEMIPEGNVAPTLAIYRGEYGDANPPIVAELSTGAVGTLGVRTILPAGEYFIVAGTSFNDRATYRMTATSFVGTDCSYWNFTAPGAELDGEVSTADCAVSGTVRSESFEIWREAGDSMTITVVADSAGSFAFGESCCENTVVFADLVNAGDSITIGHRAPRRRPYRATFFRDVFAEGPAGYRVRFH